MCFFPKVLWNLEWIFPQELEIGMRISVAVHKIWFNSQYSSTIDNYRGHIFWTQYWDPFDKYTCSPTNRRIAYWNWVCAGRARINCTAVPWCYTVDPNGHNCFYRKMHVLLQQWASGSHSSCCWCPQTPTHRLQASGCGSPLLWWLACSRPQNSLFPQLVPQSFLLQAQTHPRIWE